MLMKTWGAVSALDRMLDDVMGSSLGASTNSRAFVPDIDVRTSDDGVQVVCDVPGLKKEDIDVLLQNHVLTIKGTRRFETRDSEQVMLGRSYGAFERQFTLPDYLDEENLTANLADGVLTVSVPRHPKAKPIKIQIGGGSEPRQLKE
jgi:HSP20 family protein